MFSARFNYLVSALRLRNVDIANELFIDRSLVSRWRNGKREPSEEVIAQISQTLIKLCGTLDSRLLLCRTIHLPYEDKHFQDTRVLEYRLSAWLSSSSTAVPEAAPDGADPLSKAPQPVSAALYSGDSAYRYSMKTLLQVALEAKKPFTLYFFSNDSMDWFARDEKFQEEFQQLLEEAKEINLTVRMIFHISNNTKKMGNYIHLWSMLQTAPNAEVGGFYGIANREANRRLFSHCLLAIPEIGAMTGWSVNDSPHKYVSMTTDEKETRRVVDDCEILWSQCILLSRNREDFSYDDLVGFVTDDFYKEGSLEYLIHSEALPLGTLPPDMLQEMLEEAGAGQQEIDHMLSVHYRYIEWFHSYTDPGIIDYYYVENPVKRIYPHSSTLFGYNVSYTEERYLRHLKSTLEYARSCANFSFYTLNGQSLFPFDIHIAYGAYSIGFTEEYSNQVSVSTLQHFANCAFMYINEQAIRLPEKQFSLHRIAAHFKKRFPKLDIDPGDYE